MILNFDQVEQLANINLSSMPMITHKQKQPAGKEIQIEFEDELHFVFNAYLHNNGKRLTLLYRLPGLANDNEAAITF